MGCFAIAVLQLSLKNRHVGSTTFAASSQGLHGQVPVLNYQLTAGTILVIALRPRRTSIPRDVYREEDMGNHAVSSRRKLILIKEGHLNKQFD